MNLRPRSSVRLEAENALEMLRDNTAVDDVLGFDCVLEIDVLSPCFIFKLNS